VKRKQLLVATVATVSVLAITSCSLPTSGGGGESPNPSATDGYTVADAAALIGAATLVSTTPTTEKPEELTQFLANLKTTQKYPKQPKVDVGFKGDTIVDYSVSAKGSGGAICFIVQADTETLKTEGKEKFWSVYAEPATSEEAKDPLILAGGGVKTCDEVKKVTAEIKLTTEQRQQASANTASMVSNAFNGVPFSGLTAGGIRLFDNFRAAASQQTENPQP